MTAAGKHIVEEFESLSDAEKREVLANILTISKDLEYSAIEDGELIATADELFRDYDRRESNE